MLRDNSDASCKTSRWRILKGKLNNLDSVSFHQAMQDHPDSLLIDVRTHKEYLTGHIPGAINLDYLGEKLIDQILALPKDGTYFIYCRSGRRSIRVCTLMRNGGFDNSKIFNLSSGYNEWQESMPDKISTPKLV